VRFRTLAKGDFSVSNSINYAASAETFKDYVRSTSKHEALAKRLLIADELSDHRHTSVNSLVKAIGGNTGDRMWCAQAIRDGRIVRSKESPFHLVKGTRTEIPLRPIVETFVRDLLEWSRQFEEIETPPQIEAAWGLALDFLNPPPQAATDEGDSDQ
jgi:hypothetical protein